MLHRLSVLVLSLAVAMAVTAVIAVAPEAGAQATGCTYNGAVVACASPTPTGGLGNAFADSGGPSAGTIPTPVPTAAAQDDTAEAPQLAFTGTDSDALAYVGSGLIAFGALALAAHRRLHDD